jgi:superfamily II DNA or RNA helicase
MQCLDLLKRHGIKPELVDQKRALPPIDIVFCGDLRGYQVRAVHDLMQRPFGVLEAATGSGKTIIALAVIADRRQPTLILVHSKELLHQWAERIRSFLGIEPGLIGDGKHDVQPVTVAIVNTARKHLDTIPQHFGHIVVDEAHRTPATMFTEVVRAFDSKYMLGLTATPYRRDGLTKLIYATLGDQTHKVDPGLLREQGAVMAPRVIRRETAFKYAYADDYARMITNLTEDMTRNRLIARDIMQHCSKCPGTALVVSDRVDHCEALASLVSRAGVVVEVLTGKASANERQRVVERVRSGEVEALMSTVQLIGEGFDCPGLSSLFLATPIRFKGRLLQVVGRILRPQDGKRPVVFDYVDKRVGVLEAQAVARDRALQEVSA